MAADFVFEPPSDEEFKYENEDTDESGSGSEEVDSEDEENPKTRTKTSKKSKQTPWDFSSYVKSVAEEHASSGTTSIDFKISKALQRRSGPFIVDHDEDDNDAEPHRQVSFYFVVPEFIDLLLFKILILIFFYIKKSCLKLQFFGGLYIGI